jgi:hypothetical protein
MAAVGAAAGVAGRDPGLATAVAARAVKGGVAVDRAAGLIQAQHLPTADLHAVQASLAARGVAAPAAAALAQAAARRAETKTQLRLGQGQATPPAAAGLSGGLAGELRPLLGKLEPLEPGSPIRVLVVVRRGETLAIAPFRPRPERLREALEAVLFEAPFELALAAPPAGAAVLEQDPGPAALAAIGTQARADWVLFGALEPQTMKALVKLKLVESATGATHEASATLEGRKTGLLRLNLLPAIAIVVIGLGIFLGLQLRVPRGSLVVRVLTDGPEGDHLLCVQLSPTAAPPPMEAVPAFVERMRAERPKRTRDGATHVEQQVSFDGLPPGRVFVHLYGVYKRASQWRKPVGPEALQEVVIERGKPAFVTFDLQPRGTEFHVSVMDGPRPIAGAKVWANEDEKQARATGPDGLVVLDLPARGHHVIHVLAEGIKVERQFEVAKAKAHELAVNLVWERRVDDVARALENQPQD